MYCDGSITKCLNVFRNDSQLAGELKIGLLMNSESSPGVAEPGVHTGLAPHFFLGGPGPTFTFRILLK